MSTAERILLIGLGSNHNAEYNMRCALRALEDCFGNYEVSPFELTAAEEGGIAPDYLNAVAVFRTALNPPEVKNQLRRIENMLGRDRTRSETVAIDLDFLALGGEIDPLLELPSPDLTRCRYWLEPASQLLPDFLHPLLGRTLRDLAECGCGQCSSTN